MPRNKHIINIHTSAGTTEPTGANLYLGEIAVQHTPGSPALWIKMGSTEESNVYEKFIGETEILNYLNSDIILGDNYTYTGIPYVNSSTTLADAYSALTNEIIENEQTEAFAFIDLNDRVNDLSGVTSGHITNTIIHVTQEQKNEWTTLALSGASAYTGFTAHSADTGIHVTVEEKTYWTNGSDSGTSAWTAVNELSAATVKNLTGVTFNGSAATVSNNVAAIDYHELPGVASQDNGKVLQVVSGGWSAVTPIVVYGGADAPSASLGNNGDVYLQSESVVVYETDGTTGLLGHNNNTLTGNWQLENLDLTPFKYINCYFAASKGLADTASTPAVVVTIPLDTAASGNSAYVGGTSSALPFNRNREYMVGCAVDSTKTKFQVIHQNTLWDVSSSDANNNGRYLYKIVGYL